MRAGVPLAVIPAKAGIHFDLGSAFEEKSEKQDGSQLSLG
jgi:hypothetical protein